MKLKNIADGDKNLVNDQPDIPVFDNTKYAERERQDKLKSLVV
jgi:hypothetical protein